MINQNVLKDYLDYDPETGIFIWKKITTNRVKIGSIAGRKNNGYIVINLFGKTYKAHRLAFLYMLNFVPKYVDHIDRNRSNNCWKNLRETTLSQNGANMKRTTNYKGVKLINDYKRKKPWSARIKVNYKEIYLGTFFTIEEAAKAYDNAALKYFGEFACLNFPKEKL